MNLRWCRSGCVLALPALRALPIMALASLSLLSACDVGKTAKTGQGAEVRDSAGITIVESRAPVDGESPRYRLDSIPMVDIGRDEPHYQLTETMWSRPMGVLLSDNRILVIDEPARTLHLYSEAGTWIRDIGRSGNGPGEFPLGVELLAVTPGDTILIISQPFILAFDSSGKPISKLQHAAASQHALGRFADGNVLATGTMGTRPPISTGIFRTSTELIVIPPNGPSDTVAILPGGDVKLQNGGFEGTPLGFERNSWFFTTDSLIVVADNEVFGVDIRAMDGRLLRRHRRTYVRPAVTQADRELFLAEAAETWIRDDSKRAERIAEWRSLPYPETAPAFDHAVVARTGEIWLRQYAAPHDKNRPGLYSVFAPSGEWLTVVTVPPGFLPTSIAADRMVGLWHDEKDMPHIRVYRIRGR